MDLNDGLKRWKNFIMQNKCIVKWVPEKFEIWRRNTIGITCDEIMLIYKCPERKSKEINVKLCKYSGE